ncbi:TPA: bacteriocin [Enterococcus faecalis]|nr:bacteriocin [Enterococcus faecalis]
MNKKISFSLLILLLSLLVGFTFIPHKKELSFNEYQEKKHSGETFYVVLKKKNCSDCQDFEKLLQAPKQVYYVELTNKETMKEWSTFIRENKVLHVPSMFKIDNGHLKKIDGEGDANQLSANYQKITK